MKRAAGRLLSDKREVVTRGGGRALAFTHRIAMCQRGWNGKELLAIYRNQDGTRAAYQGLQTCGNVWQCPACAPKVTRPRADEINAAISAHLKAGGEVFFLTLTVQHSARDSGAGMLAAQMGRLGRALSRVTSLRAWRSLLKDAGVIGSIRALEVTFGELNGWHTHVHAIVFANKGAMPQLERLRRVWARELVKRDLAGLGLTRSPAERIGKLRALLTRCFTVQHGAYAAEYVAKYGKEPESAWGLASELTRSHLKTARRSGHCNPWGLLADYCEGDPRSGALWREFALASKGKRQLYWSPGLKEHFGINSVDDDQLAAAPEKKCNLFVAFVEREQWRLVLSYQAEFDLLKTAAIDGPEGVALYFYDLREAQARGSPPRFSGFFTSDPSEVFA